MKTKNVIITEYDPLWPSDYAVIASEIRQALGTLALAIHHVGSTSVPGMVAKPIIDLDVVIQNRAVLPEVIELLEAIGYRHEGDLGIPNREAFCYEGKPHLRKHHLYVCPENSLELKRHLTFRDFLRTHPTEAEIYSHIKQQAAALHPNDIDGYIQYKSAYIAKLYRQCGLI